MTNLYNVCFETLSELFESRAHTPHARVASVCMKIDGIHISQLTA